MTIRNALLALIIVLSLALAACGAAPTPEPAEAPAEAPADPAAVVQGYWQAVNDHDIEAAMTFVADDIALRGAVYVTGKDSYRSFLVGLIGLAVRTDVSDIVVSGNTVTYNWKGYDENGFLIGTGTGEVMTVEDGKIVRVDAVID